MPAEHAILGLLAITDGGGDGRGYGYDLARNFADDQPLGEVLHLEPGMLYHHLKKLERVGWVEASVQQQANRPARRTYRLAESGRAELLRWLAEPVTRTRELRLEFLVKLYFARLVDPERADRLVTEQREATQRQLASLETQLRALASPGAEAARDPLSDFTTTVLTLRRMQTEAALVWLDALSAPMAT